MRKIYRIFFFVIVFILLSTYNFKEENNLLEEKAGLFEIKKIKVFNNNLIDNEEIQEKLKKIYKKNIFLISREDIENPLNEIDFFDNVEVKKKYPNTILLTIYETEPLGIVFKDKKRFLIDSSTNLIEVNDDINFDHLPNIFGEKAESNFVIFYNKLKKNNFTIDKIKNFYFFQIERWDLQLLDEKIIKYPHNNIEDAIKKSIELLNRKDFESYKIIDLRVDGKIIVE